MQIKVSIIVPIYSVEKYLDRCVQSLVNQTLTDIEIILVDDESPDRCPQMCDEWAAKDHRIKVIHKKNGGLGFARNSGLEIAIGEYVAFVDSDDYVELDTYERAYAEATSNDLDVCYFKHRRFTNDGIRYEVCHDKSKYYFIGKAEVQSFLLNMVGHDPSKKRKSRVSMSACMGIFRHSALKELGVKFVSEKDVASEDLIFHLHFLPYVNRIGVLPDVFYNYYVNLSSTSTTYNEGKYLRIIKLQSVVKAELLTHFTWVKVKNHYYSSLLRGIKIILRYEAKSESCWSEKVGRVRRLCEEKIFKELYNDAIVRKYPLLDRGIVTLMRYKMAIPIILMYKLRNRMYRI